MKSILLHADRGPAMSARLETALALARAGHGALTVLVDTPIARYVSVDAMGGGRIAAEVISDAIAANDAWAETIEQQVAGLGVPATIVRSQAEPVEALARAAQLADLVVMSRESGLAGDLALAVRTPVLAVSDGAAMPVPPARICIAWDGGAEAALALRLALPLIVQASAVEVLTVATRDGDVDTGDAERYLALHGVKASAQTLQRVDSIEETLSAAVRRGNADLLVMGAYSHSRMREFLFGGVTRYFLEDSGGPALLLAH